MEVFTKELGVTNRIACIICGDPFTRRVTNQHQILCGKAECDVERRNDLNKENQRLRKAGTQLPEKECIICGSSFKPKTRRSVCCSEECLYKNKIKKNREAYHKDSAKREKVKKTVHDYAAKHPIKVAIKSTARVRKWRLENKRKYQAQNNECRFDGNWLKVMDRDEWTCKACGEEGTLIHDMDENKQNNNLANLVTLCRSCHSVVHNLSNKAYFETIKKYKNLKQGGRVGKETLC